jgi:hypothetical protein
MYIFVLIRTRTTERADAFAGFSSSHASALGEIIGSPRWRGLVEAGVGIEPA